MRPPTRNDWSRFDHHARRVRRLSVLDVRNSEPAFSTDRTAYNVLPLHDWAPLLSNLRHFVCYDANATEHATLLVQPSLCSLDFEPRTSEALESSYGKSRSLCRD